MKIKDKELYRLLVLALEGWDKTFGNKPLPELQTLGVLGEREWILSMIAELEKSIGGGENANKED